MSNLIPMSWKKRFRVAVIAAAFLMIPLAGVFTSTTGACSIPGTYTYYSDGSFSRQVGGITIFCDCKTCCGWGIKTNFYRFQKATCGGLQ